jgi:hypothetical protein
MTLTFSVDHDGELLIKTGQKINFGDPLVRKKEEEEIRIPLANILKINPKAIFKSLKKFVGDTVQKGEMLAEHKGMLSTKHYVSEVSGIIKEINHDEGSIVIEAEGDKAETLQAFFTGEIQGIDKGAITLKTQKNKEFPTQEATTTFGGMVLFVDSANIATLNEDDVQNKVVFAEKMMPYDTVKLETLGANGFVVQQSFGETKPSVGAIVTAIDHWETVKKGTYPYCIISGKHNTIYFYA